MIRKFLRLAFALGLALMPVTRAGAGSAPNWPLGYVPPPGEWNFWWTAKQDDLGLSPQTVAALLAGLPGGTNGQLQYNNAGAALGGTTGWTYSSSVLTATQSIGAVSTDSLVLQNTTAAAPAAQQWSPRVHWIGQGWKTNATAGSQTVDWIAEVQPVQGTANPTSNLVFSSQINAGGFASELSLSSSGNLNASGYIAAATPPSGINAGDMSAARGSGSGVVYFGSDATSYLFRTGSTFQITMPNIPVQLSSNSIFGFSSTTDASGAIDTIMRRVGAANFAFGNTDAAVPVSQFFSTQNVAAGTTNTPGGDWTFNGSRSTGNASGGNFIFKTAPAGGSGSSQNALAETFRIQTNGSILLSGTVAPVIAGTPGAGAGLISFGSNYVAFGGNGIYTAAVGENLTPAGAILAASRPLGWSSAAAGANPPTTADTALSRTAAATVALGNGTQGDTSGTLKVQNITMGATGLLSTSSGDLNVQPVGSLDLGSNSTFQFQVDTSGRLKPVSDATNDLGVASVNRLRSAFFSGTVNTGGALAVSPSIGVGYTTGAGGTVTQATSRTTGVTLNNITGAITLVSAVGSTTFQTFTVTDSAVAATDVPHVVQKSGADKYQIFVTNVAAGSFQITFATTGGTSTEQPVFNFAVIKGSAN